MLIRMTTPEESFADTACDQLLPAPAPAWDESTLATCEQLYDAYVEPAAGGWVPNSAFYDLPKWVFLEYLVKQRGLLAHGSNRDDLSHLEPGTFSRNILGWNIPRVYAYSSSVPAGFFAILDRRRLEAFSPFAFATTVYHPYQDAAGTHRERFHYGLDYRVLPHAPWRRGTVYLFPRSMFTPGYREIGWFSDEPVRPLVRLALAPWEWPLLDQVRGMDMPADLARHNAGARGFP